MPIPNYSVLKGDPVGPGQISGKNPHYRFELRTDSNASAQVDVNVQSADGSEVRYLIVNDFAPPSAAELDALALGRQALDNGTSALRLDYVLGKDGNGNPLVDFSAMQLLDLNDSRLHDAVADLLNQALADENGLIYAFGSYFDDASDEGIHNIHMNQGNPPGRFARDNGSWQDGAIFIELPSQSAKWTALFLAFETQTV